MLMERWFTCWISPGTYSQKLVWYLANIFSICRRLIHHWTLGIRCLKNINHMFLLRLNHNELFCYLTWKCWDCLLKISHIFEFSDGVEGDHLPVEAEHACCFWGVSEHASWWGKTVEWFNCGVLTLGFWAIFTINWLYIVHYLVGSFQLISLKSTRLPSCPI